MARETVRRLLPIQVQKFIKKNLQRIRLLRHYQYDFQRYWSYSSITAITDSVQLEAKITAAYHVLEKGLSMPDARDCFGKAQADSLISLLVEYRDKAYSLDSSQYQTALIVLREYLNFNEGKNCDLSRIQDFVKQTGFDHTHVSGGILQKTKSEILFASKQDFAALALSRHSVRNFTDEPVDTGVLIDAIKITQKTPSVCNRQAARVYLVESEENIRKVLALQGGNRGFGHLINKLFIVTADLRAFDGPQERNQGFIDGGMFAMSLLYALHYHGLGACALNWSVTLDTDLALRNEANNNESHVIIKKIGVGHLPETIKLAYSQRKPYTDIMCFR